MIENYIIFNLNSVLFFQVIKVMSGDLVLLPRCIYDNSKSLNGHWFFIEMAIFELQVQGPSYFPKYIINLNWETK